MDRQGSKADEMLKNVVNAKLFEKEKQFVKFGIKKNVLTFYREARIPFIIMLVGGVFLLLYCLFSGNWHVDLFSIEHGFGTLFPGLKWTTSEFFGIQIVSQWPEVVRAPKLVAEAWPSYVFVPIEAVGIVWFLICTQAYIARSIRIYKMARGIYRKKLDQQPTDPTSPTQSL